ncbi:P22 phage major capsid protein family protein [Roseibium sp. RKSG952]|uniref:P22 phage major capsid protein family protein n=1 Tax=Roseibium sp. RKSG952 TaxID=2529384 RepID=UPI0012BD3C53|nr:P22 phage major capsid protein family protein [Roseibium sp. RKSG952]MTH96413.1 P22 coat - protein 5 family protein [Roseibium sp. RKSG952]
MANILDGLAADIYKAADIVGREIVGYIPSCTINAGTEGVAVGQNVNSHFTQKAEAVDIAPSMTIPEGDDQTVDVKQLSLSKQRGVQIPWTGEEVGYVNAGAGFQTVYGDQIAQAMRTITNEIETDLAIEAYTNASRAIGTAGTTPFASDFDKVAEGRQILLDNAMPVSDGRVSLVLSSTAGTKLRNLAQLQKANEAGGTQLLRQGTLLDLQGVMIKESLQAQLHIAGTGADYDTSGTHGADAATLALTGGTPGASGIKAGDVVTFAGDTNQYVVNSGLATAAGNIELGAPGLREAAANATALTIGDNYTANVFLHQSALELAIRPPASPIGGDAASDVMIVQDPHSGLTFEISVYKGFKKTMIMVGAVWGKKAWKPDAIALLMG